MTILPSNIINEMKKIEEFERIKKQNETRKRRLQQKYKNYIEISVNAKIRKIQSNKISLLVDKFYTNKASIQDLIEHKNSCANYWLLLDKLRAKLYNTRTLTIEKYNQMVEAIRVLGDMNKIRSYDFIKRRHKNLKNQIEYKKMIPGRLKSMNNNPKWYK